MQNEQIVFFETLDMGWVISERVLDQIGAGNFSRRKLGEVSINPDGKAGTDREPNTEIGLP